MHAIRGQKPRIQKSGQEKSNFRNVPKRVAQHWEGRSAYLLREKNKAGPKAVKLPELAPEKVDPIKHQYLIDAINGLKAGDYISWPDQVKMQYKMVLRPCSWVLVEMDNGQGSCARIAQVSFIVVAPRQNIYVGLEVYYDQAAIQYEDDGAMYMSSSYIADPTNNDEHILLLADLKLTMLQALRDEKRVHFVDHY